MRRMASPNPAQVDAKAKEYLDLKDEVAKILKKAADDTNIKTVRMAELREEMTELVTAHGSAHAEKSKLLHGIEYEIMGTFGSSVSIDAAAVERFRLELVKEKKSRLLKKMFDKTVRWTLSPIAATVVKGEKLGKSLLALYSQCEVVTARTPTIVPRLKAKSA